MKRSGPLRRTPLKRTAMKRRPKRAGDHKGVHRATPDERERIRNAKGKRCRVCGAFTLQLHHLLGGILRTDRPENLIPLCGSGTTGCHGIYTSRMTGVCGDGIRRTWAQIAGKIRATLTTSEREFVISQVGHDGLDKRYPKSA